MISPEYKSTVRHHIAKWKDSGLSYYQICRIKLGGRLSAEEAQQIINSHKPAKSGLCHECGKFSKRRDNHHTNYEKDIVVPLCVRCHRKHHLGPRMKSSGVLPHSEHELSLWFPNWNGESQLSLQVRITNSNKKMLEEYQQLCLRVIPMYCPTLGSIANGMLTDKLREEIKRMKGKKV